MSNITFTVKGIEKLKDGLGKFTESGLEHLSMAGIKAIQDYVFSEVGTPGNYPPYQSPTYERGRGKSQKMGTRYSESSTRIYQRGASTIIHAGATYASYVIGLDQTAIMAGIGWKPLERVIEDNLDKVRLEYQIWINRAIKEAGLD